MTKKGSVTNQVTYSNYRKQVRFCALRRIRIKRGIGQNKSQQANDSFNLEYIHEIKPTFSQKCI